MRRLIIPILILLFATLSAYAAGDDFTPLEVICRGQTLDTGYEYHGNLYISLDDFMRYGETSKFRFDPLKYQIFFEPGNMEIFIADSETTEFIKKNVGTVHVSMRGIGSKLYVPLKILAQMSRLDYDLQGERLFLYPNTSASDLLRVSRNCSAAASLISGGGHNVVLIEGQFCRLIEDLGAFCLVEILNGETVYIMSDCLKTPGPGDSFPEFSYAAKEKLNPERRFNVAWDVSPKGAPPKAEGIDVIAPFEWFFQMVDRDGELGNNANIGYTDTAHANGYRVWATATNAFTTSGSSRYTLKVMQDKTLRNKTVAQYLFYCALYDVDGLNVDYEDLYLSGTKDGFTAFIKTLSEYGSRMGLDISVATLVPETWNLSIYDYEALGNYCDYVCAMAYDEHYNLSSGPGSTSSKPWYTRNMETLCNYVNPDKIIMGVPLYSFVCRFDSSGKFATSAKHSQSRTLTNVRNAAERGDIKVGPVWLDDMGQYYVEFMDGAYLNKIWLEDSRSMAVRLDCVNRLGLAGTACWGYSYVDPSFYDLFKEVYVNEADPLEFQPEYPLFE